MSNETSEDWRKLAIDTILGDHLRRATFGGRIRRAAGFPWVRVVLRPVELQGEKCVQFSYFDAKKNITRNFQHHELEAPLDELLDAGFAGIHLSTDAEEIDIRRTRKGKVQVGRKKTAAAPERALAHNRVKNVPLPEGKADRLLEAMGILTREGHVRPTMRAKYTQINKFLELLTHALEDAGMRSLGRPVEILDCACGASYLTLAVHHYLESVLGIPAHIVGVDINEEVIRKSIERSERLAAARLEFRCNQIADVETKPDMVLALHACDTATDDAIAQAIACEARLLMSVPCCHHNLNDMLRPTGPAEVLRPLLRHGILHQRTADLVTDAFRALILRIMGYRTDVIEFISTEHTARNLMIRAVRGAPVGESSLVREYAEMRRFWGVTPYLESVMGARFQSVLS